MAFFERFASNANSALNSESATAAKKKLIKKGRNGSIIFLSLFVALIVSGVLFLVYKISTVAGILCLVAASLSFIFFIVYLITLIIGIGMAAGGMGAKILDTTSVCPYCQTVLSAKEKQCPSCGKLKDAA